METLNIFETVERECFYNSIEFFRLGYTDLSDKQECKVHGLSYRSVKENRCPLCMMRERLGITTEKGLGVKEYAYMLCEDGYEPDWVRKNILKSFKGDKP